MAISGRIVLAPGEPVRNSYVRHADSPFSGERTYRTDGDGVVEIDSEGDWFSNEVEVKVFAQNTLVRMLDGGTIPVPFQVYQTVRFGDGETAQVGAQQEHFRIAERLQGRFEQGLGDFTPWRGTPPLAPTKVGTPRLEAEMDGVPRIDVSFPDMMLQPTPFVEPKSIASEFPLLHLKRPIGGSGPSSSTLTHELAHALHFAKLSTTTRARFQDGYLGWLVDQAVNGLPTSHSMSVRTSPLVAFVEAFGLFATEYTADGLSAAARREQFFATARRPDRDTVRGGDVEGAVYAALFLDYAQAIAGRASVGENGLDWVVTKYVESEATTVEEFRAYIRQEYGRSEEFLILRSALHAWGIDSPRLSRRRRPRPRRPGG